MSIPITGTKAAKLKEEKKRIERAAKGEVAGIISSVYELKDFGELNGNLTEMVGKSKSKPAYTSGAIYATAMLRDAPYTCVGRRYLRVQSLSDRSRALYMRALQAAFWKELSDPPSEK